MCGWYQGVGERHRKYRLKPDCFLLCAAVLATARYLKLDSAASSLGGQWPFAAFCVDEC